VIEAENQIALPPPITGNTSESISVPVTKVREETDKLPVSIKGVLVVDRVRWKRPETA
jgi:hypothetical protein